mgnify:FL=1
MIDLAIIGGGPAGLTAGLYATRGGLKNVIMYEKGMPGGQITSSSEIENYPGISVVTDGISFMAPWSEQCTRFGLKIEMKSVERVEKISNGFCLHFEDASKQEAKCVIVCTGSKPRRAGIKGENEFFGRGVSTCATCDGFFYKGKEVAVLGGGDTAVEEALYLSELCSKVYLIHRRDEFRAAPNSVERAKKCEKIEFVLNAVVDEILGDSSGVTGLRLSYKDGKTRQIEVPGIFVFVGLDVLNNVLSDNNGGFICEMTPQGNVKVNLKMQTSLPGLWACGDLRQDAPKQVVCAAGDGAVAALDAIEYLRNHQ